MERGKWGGAERSRAKQSGAESDIGCADYMQYSDLSMTGGMGLISVPNSCSILYMLLRSSYVIRLIAKPK